MSNRIKKNDLIGRRFGRLVVINEYDRDKYGKMRYMCICDCGNKKIAGRVDLLSGHTKSCGCYWLESIIASNRKYTKEEKILYDTWKGMRQRCNNKNHKLYHCYGGRGICICEEWNDYLAFYHWAIENGYEKGKQIDRIDNDGNYEPSNCRWVTQLENANNKSINTYYVIDGVRHTFAEWCRIYGINYYTADGRVRRMGWDIEKALTTPLLRKGRNIKKK